MNRTPQTPPLRLVQTSYVLLALLPLAWLIRLTANDALGEEPITAVQAFTGSWTLNFLILTLSITPLRSWTQWHWLTRLRRISGLITFFYGSLHALAYLWLAQGFAVDAMARDISRHPFIAVGIAAFLLLIPLAATSSKRAVRRLGGKRWQELHRSIYPIAILGCVHYLWSSKPDELPGALVSALIVAGLLGWRARERKRRAIAVPVNEKPTPLRFYNKRPD